MVKDDNPCYGCKERHTACHVTCERGKASDERHVAKRNKRRKEIEKESEVVAVITRKMPRKR